MKHFNFFDKKTRDRHLSRRPGETKFGEKLPLVKSIEELRDTAAQYVIIGVPEDIGIRANYGKPGAAETWEYFLDSFLNIQANRYNNPHNCVILGHLDCEELMNQADLEKTKDNYPESLGKLVSAIDSRLSELIETIVGFQKTPIIIGGGHNNAYPNIKGTANALRKAINVVNIDAHTDLRTVDYRHSGNGFSLAIKEEYLDKYHLFGIHKNYTPEYIFERFPESSQIEYYLYEDLFSLDKKQLSAQFEVACNFSSGDFGLEIDCDAIEYFPSSAVTSSGFSVQNIREFIRIAKRSDVHYLHLAEAVAAEKPEIAKALSYFVSDFIRQKE